MSLQKKNGLDSRQTIKFHFVVKHKASQNLLSFGRLSSEKLPFQNLPQDAVLARGMLAAFADSLSGQPAPEGFSPVWGG